MWFKNLICYGLSSEWQHSAAALETLLQDRPARPCGSLELQTMGFAAPSHADERLVHATGAWQLVQARESKKLLPAAVIRELLEERVEQVRDREGRDIGRKEKMNLKEEVIHDALPKAFCQSRNTVAMINAKQGWFWVDASSATRAEQISETLREAAGSLPIRPLQPSLAPEDVLTEWLQSGKLPAGFVLGDRCELVGPAPESPTVRYSRHALDTDEVLAHIKQGKRVTKLGLLWKDQLEFDLTADLELKRLKFLDVLKDEMSEDDDPVASLLATMTLMGAALNEVLSELLPLFGAVPDLDTKKVI